jgi:hypothetical protein
MSRRGRARLALCTVLAAAAGQGAVLGCGDRPDPARPALAVPARRATAGDALLAFAPAGADAVLEVDLARLRSNGAVGELARAVLPVAVAGQGQGEGGAAPGVIGLDVLVAMSYGLGEGEPKILMLGRGPAAERLAGAELLPGGVVALGDPALVRRAQATAHGHEPAVTSDRELQILRAWPMPSAAGAAAVRLTARLTFDGRVALARRLDLDVVPRTISIWADVVDDLAVVALLGAERSGDAARLERDSQKLVARLARAAPLFGRPLARELGRTRVVADGPVVRFTLVIGPRRLARLVAGALELVRGAATRSPATPEGT